MMLCLLAFTVSVLRGASMIHRICDALPARVQLRFVAHGQTATHVPCVNIRLHIL